MKPGNAGGAKGPWVKVNVRSSDSLESGVSLVPPRTVGKLQATLHAKAKGSPDCVGRTDGGYPGAGTSVVASDARGAESGYSRFPDAYLHGELGLVQLRLCDRNVPWAKA